MCGILVLYFNVKRQTFLPRSSATKFMKRPNPIRKNALVEMVMCTSF